jgi:hypothetical protein
MEREALVDLSTIAGDEQLDGLLAHVTEQVKSADCYSDRLLVDIAVEKYATTAHINAMGDGGSDLLAVFLARRGQLD